MHRRRGKSQITRRLPRTCRRGRQWRLTLLAAVMWVQLLRSAARPQVSDQESSSSPREHPTQIY